MHLMHIYVWCLFGFFEKNNAYENIRSFRCGLYFNARCVRPQKIEHVPIETHRMPQKPC